MKNILIIRRDNIGDLVCTTPLIEGIKTAFPDARICLLINTVSQDVVRHNPHIDQTFVYRKAKHRSRGDSKLGVYFDRLKIFMQLRRIDFDATILANPTPCRYSLRLAKLAGVKHIIGADTGDGAIDVAFKPSDFKGEHQVEKTFSYLSAMTKKTIAIPPVRVWLTEDERRNAAERLSTLQPAKTIGLAIHISSRSPKRRWPVDRYVAIIKRYLELYDGSVIILWSPQGTLSPDDVGDQQRASQVLAACGSDRVSLYPTASVRELLAVYEPCLQLLCSDGGQMHLAAAMNKKVVAFFGDTNPTLWHPWVTGYSILQTASGECTDVTVEEVWEKIAANADGVPASVLGDTAVEELFLQ